jgi:hypothetical protein
MAIAGILRILVQGDTSGLETDLQAAVLAGARFGDKLRSAFDTAGSAASKFVGGMSALPVALLGGTMGLLLTQVTQFADRIDEAAGRLGLATDAFQALELQAREAGATQQQFERGMAAFNVKLGEAAAGGAKAQEAFKRLGVTWEELGRTRSTEAVFRDTMEALGKIPNAADRAAAGVELFGAKAGPALIQAFRDGAIAMDEFEQRARDMGLILDHEAVQNLGRLNDNIDRLSERFVVLAANVINKAMPALEGFLDWANRATTAVAGLVRTFGEQLGLVSSTSQGLYLQAAQLRARIAAEESQGKGLASSQERVKLLRQELDLLEAKARAAEAEENASVGRAARARAEAAAGGTGRVLGPQFDPRAAAKEAAEAEKAASEARKELVAGIEGAETDMAAFNFQLERTSSLFSAYSTTANRGVTETVDFAGATRNLVDVMQQLGTTTADLDDVQAQLVAKTLADLEKRMAEIAVEAEVFGAAFDETAAKVQAVRAALEKMIEGGLTPATPAMQKLRAEFEKLTTPPPDTWNPLEILRKEEEARSEALREKLVPVTDTLKMALTSVDRAFSTSITGVIQGTQTVKQAFAKMGESIVLSLQETIIKRGIDAVSKALDELLKSEAVQKLIGAGISAVSAYFGGGAGGYSEASGGGYGAIVQNITVGAKMAAGGVVQSPTVSLIGEAGPEAVIPLDRMGEMGSGVTVNIIDQRKSGNIEQKESIGENGQPQIDVLITDVVRGGISAGTFDRSLAAAYGLTRKGAAR